MPPQLLPQRDRRYKTTNCVRINLKDKYKNNNKKQPFFNQSLHFQANLTSLIADLNQKLTYFVYSVVRI